MNTACRTVRLLNAEIPWPSCRFPIPADPMGSGLKSGGAPDAFPLARGRKPAGFFFSSRAPSLLKFQSLKLKGWAEEKGASLPH